MQFIVVMWSQAYTDENKHRNSDESTTTDEVQMMKKRVKNDTTGKGVQLINVLAAYVLIC